MKDYFPLIFCCVGDTFPVGCRFDETNVFYKYFEQNPDSQDPKYNTKLGIYSEGIGLDNVHFSWGHDEYMYQVCVQNNCKLPPEALAIIRYHSFYPWHKHGAYAYLTNEHDQKMLFWVREFQKHDLYSKLPEKPDVEKLVPFYQKLIDKYFPKILKW
jgi:inositol oxygenase